MGDHEVDWGLTPEFLGDEEVEGGEEEVGYEDLARELEEEEECPFF